MQQDTPDLDRHLTEAELFALAIPAAGEPEALPRHLTACRACSRALQDWKAAVQELADEDAGEVGRRTDEEWRAAEDATLARLRLAGSARRPSHRLRWAVAIAASLLVAALLLPLRRHAATVAVSAPTPAAAEAHSPAAAGNELDAADQADDELLRQASYLAAGGDLESEVSAEGRL